MLFLPWHAEEEIMRNYLSYYDRYMEEKDRIEATEERFIHQEKEILSAFQQLEEGPPESAWDNVATGAAEEELYAHEQGVTDE